MKFEIQFNYYKVPEYSDKYIDYGYFKLFLKGVEKEFSKIYL